MAKKKRKKKSKKQQQLEKKFYQKVFLCLFIAILIIITGKYIYNQKKVPALDETISNNISFRNAEATDILKITDIVKMTDKKGKSILNQKKVEFDITGSAEQDYQIIIYPITSDIAPENINYYLKIGDDEVIGTLSNGVPTNDGGYIILNNKINENSKCLLKMWLNENQDEDQDNCFEIKIK